MPDDSGPIDPVDEAACDLQRRAWLKVITPLLQLRSHDTDPSPRVQLAYDLMAIAAAERAARLLRSDLAEPAAGE